IIQGQVVYLAEAGEIFTDPEGRQDCRLRVIFDNGTESGMLRRSLQKRLWEDHSARRIVAGQDLGPLFSNVEEDGDQAVGYVYVLRSKSENPFIVENRKVIHKIGITSGSVKKRVANAAKDPTYLLAEVDIIETYKVSNMDLTKLEKLLHKFFDVARLDVQLKDRFGFDVEPREWFLVPLPIIEEVIEKLIDGTLPNYRYSPDDGMIIKV
ncbi:MAG: GIY-YIG nuclease family protein, partial [Akkermansiaceae bacterium]